MATSGPGAFIKTEGTFAPASSAEATIVAVSTTGKFQLRLGLNPNGAGDTLEVRAYATDKSSGTSRCIGMVSFAGAQPADNQLFISDEYINGDTTAESIKWTYKQTAGSFDNTYTYSLHNLTDGAVNVTQLLGTAWLTPGTAGTPDVNAKLWNGLTTVELPLVPTTAGRKLDVSAGGEAGVDWANVGTPSSAVNLSATTTNLVNTVTTYTGNTVQTGDSFARIGAAGAGLTGITGVTLSATGSVTLTEGYATDGSGFNLAQGMYMIWSLLAERSRSGTTLTSGKLDGTAAMTFTLDSATAPTSQTRAT